MDADSWYYLDPIVSTYRIDLSVLDVQLRDAIATVVLQRGKVNAINPTVVEELSTAFAQLQRDSEVRAVVLTGHGTVFSFGFDIPEFLSYTREQFTRFVTDFARLYRDLLVFPSRSSARSTVTRSPVDA